MHYIRICYHSQCYIIILYRDMIKLENYFIAIYGITTVIVFIAMVIFGGLFDSIHTVFFREVSFFISPYSLRQSITVPLYRLYNIQLFMFSIVLFIRLKNIFARLGALYLSLSAILGIILIQFPMDPRGISESVSGTTHIIFVILTALHIVIAIALLSDGFRRNKNLFLLSTYSTEISIVILVAGFLTGIFAFFSMPFYVGFFEKLPVAAFLGWIFLTSVWMIKSDKRVRYVHKHIVRKSGRGKFK